MKLSAASPKSCIETLESRTLMSASHPFAAKAALPNIKGNYQGALINAGGGSTSNILLSIIAESKAGAIRAITQEGPGNSAYEADRLSGTFKKTGAILLRGRYQKYAITLKATISSDLNTITGSDTYKAGKNVFTSTFSITRVPTP